MKAIKKTDNKNRSFFHEGMREFQDLFDVGGLLRQLKRIESIMISGMMRKKSLRKRHFFL